MMPLKLVQVAFFACLSVMVTAEGQECMTDDCKEQGDNMLQASEQALRRQALLQESDFERNTQGPGTCGVKGTDETPWTPPKPGKFGAKIVNGQTATECEWPWQASLRQRQWGSYYAFCGGTLIHQKWVLTAAHCISADLTPNDLTVVLGDFDVSTIGSNEKQMSVKAIIKHPSYNSDTMSHDFALIELMEAAPLDGKCIGVACLPSAPIQNGQECYITGWGTLKSDGDTPDFLQEAQVETLDNKACDKKNGGSILDNMLCAQGRNKYNKVTDACQGDSGGPLVCADPDGKYSVHGATSWGIGCANEARPGVWARTTSVLEWIRGTMDGGPPPPAPVPYAAFASSIVSD